MKKLTISFVLLLATVFAFNVNAQDNFTTGTDYHLLYLDGATKTKIPAASIKQDYTVDDTNHFLYIWDGTYTNPTSAGPNWNGEIGEYLTFQVASVGWSGFGFACNPAGTATKDMSAVTSAFTLHIAMKATNTATHCFIMEGGAGISARVAVGASSFVDGSVVTPAYTNFTRNGQWQLVEIPMSEFFNKGLRYPAPFKGNAFAMLSGGVAGTTVSIDAVYVYRKIVAGINDVNSSDLNVMVTNKTLTVLEATQPIELYSITGSKIRTSNEKIMDIEDIQKGIYIVRSGNMTKKVQIK